MIPVTPCVEPAGFDLEVRQAGSDWLKAQGLPLVGPLPPRVKPDDLWRHCLREMRILYSNMCAFAAVYIPPVVGSATVEHFKPKSLYAEYIYEWDNYRLMCGTLNGRKSNHEDVLDPFTLPPGVFELDILLQIHPAPGPLSAAAASTIRRLKLDGSDALELRRRDWDAFLTNQITATWLRSVSPFVHAEMVRLQQIDPGKTGLLRESQ